MKKIVGLILLVFPIFSFSQSSFNLDRDWGTYFGDNRFSLQNSQTDNEGNLYIVGYVWGQYGDVTEDFNYFDNAPHQSNYAGGVSDGFIAKFDSLGTLVWATLFGGENTDIIEGVTVDKANNIYIMGFTDSEIGISTPNAYQEERPGNTDLFISKFNPEGGIEWSTYYGDGSTSTISLTQFAKANFLNSDTDGNYITHDGESSLFVTSSFVHVELESATVPPTDGLGNNFIGKFTDNGEFVWSTFYGINKSELSGICSCNNALYLTGYVMSLPNSEYPENNTYFGTPNAYQPTASSVLKEGFLVKFDSTGSRVWGTYYGGNSSETMVGNNLVCDEQANLFHAMVTSSENMASAQAFQEDKNYGPTPILTKFEDNSSDVDPARAWATYYGNGDNDTQSGEKALSVVVNNQAIYISGATGWSENIASEGAWQESMGTNFRQNAFVAKFNQSGERVWGTYYNGEDGSYAVKVLPYGNSDNFYLVGKTASTLGMTTLNGLQPEHVVIDSDYWAGSQGTGNIFITHFSPAIDDLGLSKNNDAGHNISLFPNPANSYTQLQWNSNTNFETIKYNVVDLSGRVIIQNTKMEGGNGISTINIDKLVSGVYFVNVYEQEKLIGTKKLIVNK